MSLDNIYLNPSEMVDFLFLSTFILYLQYGYK